jgi:hypothetical protein
MTDETPCCHCVAIALPLHDTILTNLAHESQEKYFAGLRVGFIGGNIKRGCLNQF